MICRLVFFLPNLSLSWNLLPGRDGGSIEFVLSFLLQYLGAESPISY